MADSFQLASIALAIASLFVYVAVGRQVGRRQVSAEGKFAIRMFQLWWYGLAVLSVFTPLLFIMSQFGLDTYTVLLVLIQVLLILIFAAFAGLVYYLLYLYTGARWVMGVVIGYFVLMVIFLEYILWDAHIAGYGVPLEGGAKMFLDASGHAIVTKGLASLIFAVLIGLPPLVSTFAYFLLYFRVTGAEQKFRIALVSASLVVWFGTQLFGALTGLSQNPATKQAWQITNAVVDLCAAIAIFAAYKPPAWIRRKLEPTAQSTTS